MKKEEKIDLVQNLVSVLNQYNNIYFTGTSVLDAVSDNQFRRLCFENNVKVMVVKNSLLRKAMVQIQDKVFGDIDTTLVGQTALFFADVANLPAKLIREFEAKVGKAPLFKAAYIDGVTYIGAEKLQSLVDLKSKEELLADVLALLQAPIKNVLSALKEAAKNKAETIEAEA